LFLGRDPNGAPILAVVFILMGGAYGKRFMNNQQINEEDDADTAVDITADGVAAFSELRGSIHRSLFDLRTDFPTPEDGKKRVEGNVKLHLAEITKLLEAGHGENSENVLPANPGNTLDLERAREEINRRVAKLINQRRD
jgi:hypothetical protein